MHSLNPCYIIMLADIYINSTWLILISTYFLHKDGLLFKTDTVTDALKMFFTEEKLFFRACSIFFRYLDPRFHPSQSDIDELAEFVFKSQQHLAAI